MLGLVARMTSCDALVGDAHEQLLDPQLLGTDALDRRDRALQHVVPAAELLRALDRDDVARLLDDAQHGRIAPLVATERAQLTLGDVEAPAAPRDALLRLDDRRGEPLRVLGRRLQQVERDALRRLRADAGQPAELVDELLDRDLVEGRHPRQAAEAAEVEPAGDARPCFSACSSCARRSASLTAATTRSSSISTSSGSTTSGEIVTACSSPAPVTVAFTMPPPAEPSTVALGERVLRRGHVGLHLLHLPHHLVHLLLVRHGTAPEFGSLLAGTFLDHGGAERSVEETERGYRGVVGSRVDELARDRRVEVGVVGLGVGRARRSSALELRPQARSGAAPLRSS